MTGSKCQLLAPMLCAPALTGVFGQQTSELEVTASASRRLHLSSGCGYGPDEVLKVHCANEYCCEDEVLNELTSLQLEG